MSTMSEKTKDTVRLFVDDVANRVRMRFGINLKHKTLGPLRQVLDHHLHREEFEIPLRELKKKAKELGYEVVPTKKDSE